MRVVVATKTLAVTTLEKADEVLVACWVVLTNLVF